MKFHVELPIREDDNTTACPSCRGGGLVASPVQGEGPRRCPLCNGSGYGPDPAVDDISTRCLERLALWANRNLREETDGTF